MESVQISKASDGPNSDHQGTRVSDKSDDKKRRISSADCQDSVSKKVKKETSQDRNNKKEALYVKKNTPLRHF